jgi:hypothetical protein
MFRSATALRKRVLCPNYMTKFSRGRVESDFKLKRGVRFNTSTNHAPSLESRAMCKEVTQSTSATNMPAQMSLENIRDMEKENTTPNLYVTPGPDRFVHALLC